ncbi:MAG: MFS transporter [Alphaproteobacteria bacterium]|nr:MFS transporter [Alphaproteobacteria bacterium]
MKSGTEHAIGPRALLANPSYLRLWLAGGLANAMRFLEMLVAGIFTFELTGSAFSVAAVTVARTLPMLFIGVLAGVVAEAVNRRTLLLGGLVVMTINSAVLWALSASGQIAVWHIAAAGLVAGVVWASEMAVRRRMVSEVVPSAHVGQAVALDSVTSSSTRMIGPLIGGAVFEAFGLDGAYLVSTIVHVAAAAIVTGLVFSQETRRLALARIPAEIAEGIEAVRGRPALVGVVAVTVVMNMFGFSYSALIAPIGLNEFQVSAVLVGLLAAAEPLGALVTGFAFAAGWLPMRGVRTLMAGSFLFLAGLVATALAPWYALAFVFMVVGGLGTAAFGSMQSTLVLTEAPAALRSRVMGIVTMCIGTGPIGVLLVGFASDWLGASRALLAMALIGVVGLLLARLSWPRDDPH